MIAGFHSWVIEILKDGQLVLCLDRLQVLGSGEVTTRLWEKVRFIESQRIADEHDPLRAGFGAVAASKTQRVHRQW